MNYYSNEKDILELVALIKEHGIKRAIVSPGSTNISFAACLLHDPDIEVFSEVDERSAAYMACGLAAETGEPVVISCTGATASRNYLPALTEAYYRKLPVLAVTSSQHFGRVGQYIPQVTDRNGQMKDIVVKSVHIPIACREEDSWANNVKINDALLELKRHGGGPVHINIETSFSKIFDVRSLPRVRVINRVFTNDEFPKIKAKRVVVFVGSHTVFDNNLSEKIDRFCERNNAVVVCDHTSNYKGNYRVLGGLALWQSAFTSICRKPDLVIHIGEMSGSYYSFPDAEVWRVSPDGEIRDSFRKLRYVFEMDEDVFFSQYCNAPKRRANYYLKEWRKVESDLQNQLKELPFSNAWIAQQTASRIPESSAIHFGILNSLRMWNLFEIPTSVSEYSNVGGFGIDGNISSLIGASLANKEKLYFLVLGDLSTFYDLNALGNRHIGNNIRLLVINNGTGFEMRHKNNRGDVFKEDADILFAAGGHFGNKSRTLLKDYVQNLGFDYLSAENKEEYKNNLQQFLDMNSKKSIVFEVFAEVADEYESFEQTRFVACDRSEEAKRIAKNIIGEKGVAAIKGIKTKLK